jgi:hypothetical protein
MCQWRFLKDSLVRAASFLLLIFLSLSEAQAQGTLQVSASASTVAKTGQTESAGPVTVTVVSGTTVAGTIDVSFPSVTFTNSAASGITLTGTGGFAAATFVAIPASGIVSITVPGGATAGSSVTLSGVRISMVGQTSQTLDVQISSSGNPIVAGQNADRVIAGAVDGLIVDNTTVSTFSLQNGSVIGVGNFVFGEGSVTSFSSSVGVAGQTVPTQIIFQVTGLPDNVSVTFPATLTSNNAATLTTLSGFAETLTNSTSTNRVTYSFTDSAASPFQIDSFTLLPTVSVTGAAGSGTAFIQATLGPIGAAIPGGSFPSTAIPRFAEQLLPPITSPIVVTRSIFFPVSAGISASTIAVSNTATGGGQVLFRARGSDGSILSGPGITNEITVSLGAKQTTVSSPAQVFGSGVNLSSIGSIEVQSANNSLVGTSIESRVSGRFASPFTRELTQFYLLFDRKTSVDVPTISVHNAGASAGSVTFTVSSTAGQIVGTATKSVNAGGAIGSSLSDLISVQPGTLPLSGYVFVNSTVPLRSSLVNNPAGVSDEVTGQLAVDRSPMIFPFFAFGGGYDTVLSLVNSSAQSAQVTLTPLRTDGTPIPGTSPVIRQIPTLSRLDLDFGSLFSNGGAGITSGYFALGIARFANNPFSGIPQLIGIVRVSNGTSSAVAPLAGDSSSEFFLTPVVATATQFTGVAIANEALAAIQVTIEAYSAAGSLQGSTTFSLPGSGAQIKLLQELVTTASGIDGGFIRVSSTGGPADVLGFRGTNTLSELLYLKAQTLP